MIEKKKIPAIRFSEFSEDWVEVKLKQVFQKGVEKGKIELPIFSVSQELGLVRRDSLDRSIQQDASPESHLKAYQGDIVYNMMRMWQGAYGIAPVNCMISPAYIVLRAKHNHDPKFYFYQFKKSRSKYLFWAYSYGLTNDRLRLYYKDFGKIERTIPSLPEQQKIASFLTAVDSKIEQLIKKKNLLEQYKKGVMQKIFSREIRFKDEIGNDYPDWEEKRLKDILTIGNGKDYKGLERGNIPVYGTGGIMTFTNKYLYDGESVCIGRKGTIDKPVYLNGKFWTVDTLFFTHSFVQSNAKFIYYVFLTVNWKTYNEASGVPSLSKTTIEKIKIQVPCRNEQTQIANLLSTIDEKIKLVDTQLEKTQQFKKGLLQQMFV